MLTEGSAGQKSWKFADVSNEWSLPGKEAAGLKRYNFDIQPTNLISFMFYSAKFAPVDNPKRQS